MSQRDGIPSSRRFSDGVAVTTRISARFCIALLAAALLRPPAIAVAQPSRVPARIGNTWDWRHHEPVAGQVRRAEREAHVAVPSVQRQAATGEVEHLYRQLLRRSP